MGAYTYYEEPCSIKCGIVGSPSYVYDNFYAHTVDVIKDERAVKPRPLSNTNMQITRRRVNAATVRVGGRYGSVGYCVTGMSYQIIDETTSAGAHINAAKRKLGQGEWNLGIFLVELDDTVKLVSKMGYRALNAYKAIKSGKLDEFINLTGAQFTRRGLKRAKDALKNKDLEGFWLETQFGILPLLNDVFGAMNAAHSKMTGVGMTVKGRSGTKPPKSPKGRKTPTHFASPAYVPPNGGRGSGHAYAEFTGTVRNAQLRSLQELGLINPAHLAWNKIPLSFVIDWILPIGDILAGLTAGAGLYNIRGYCVWERNRWREYTNGMWNHHVQYVYREPLTYGAVGLPLRFNTLSAWHFATSFSLAATRLR